MLIFMVGVGYHTPPACPTKGLISKPGSEEWSAVAAAARGIREVSALRNLGRPPVHLVVDRNNLARLVAECLAAHLPAAKLTECRVSTFTRPLDVTRLACGLTNVSVTPVAVLVALREDIIDLCERFGVRCQFPSGWVEWLLYDTLHSDPADLEIVETSYFAMCR